MKHHTFVTKFFSIYSALGQKRGLLGDSSEAVSTVSVIALHNYCLHIVLLMLLRCSANLKIDSQCWTCGESQNILEQPSLSIGDLMYVKVCLNFLGNNLNPRFHLHYLSPLRWSQKLCVDLPFSDTPETSIKNPYQNTSHYISPLWIINQIPMFFSDF